MNSSVITGVPATIVSGDNDTVFDTQGNKYIDLFAGSGTVFLGHCNPAISDALAIQAQKTWNTGLISSEAREKATARFETMLMDDYRLAGFYSTGMEASEFAIRISRVTTGRPGFIGFERCLHGKSMAAAYLGWENENVLLPDFSRLGFMPNFSEDEILSKLELKLRDENIAAVFVELLMGSGGGHLVSTNLAGEIAGLCSKYGSLLVCDEIFTGFYRAGPRFLHELLGIKPDIVLVGKTLGNGFPVSGVVITQDLNITPKMLPGSTYAGNALACAVVEATLAEMQSRNVANLVEQIAQIIVSNLSGIDEYDYALRGNGALWVVETKGPDRATALARTLWSQGVIASATGPFLRLIPPATITADNLFDACQLVNKACIKLA